MKKVCIIVLTILGLWVIIPTTHFIYADPMDPLNSVQSTVPTKSSAGEAIQPNAPGSSNKNDNISNSIEDKSQADWEEEEKQRKNVQLMDTIMLVAGIIAVIIPTLYMGIYLGARIFPPLFAPVFAFITRKKVHPEDLPIPIMFLRTIPVAVLGMLMATGWLRQVFAYVWSFILKHFVK